MRTFLSSIKDQLIHHSLQDDARRQLSAMTDELRRGGPLYLPSRFWTDLNAMNEAQLAAEDLENFKGALDMFAGMVLLRTA